MAALARELAKRHEVTVLTSKMRGLPAECVERGVRVLRVPVFFRRQLSVANFPSMLAYLPSGAWRARGIPRKTSFDVVNTHFVVPTGPLGQWIADRLELPNVLSVHGGDLFDPSKRLSPHRHFWLRWPVRKLLGRADAVVAQSRDTLSHVDGIYGVHREVELIPLGIDRPPLVAQASRRAFGLPDNAFVLVTVGRLVPRKQIPQLVSALALSGISNAHLLVVGSGPEEPAIRRAVAEHGLHTRVHMLGQVSEHDKHQALAVADVFASTSAHEGFGLVFLEAMAFGLPVICFDKGGQTDFLASGKTGTVVSLNNVEMFAAAIRELSRSGNLRATISASNRRAVEEFFIDRCAARYESIFEGAIEQRCDRRGHAASSGEL